MRRLVIGCGYLGARVARAWLDAGDTVYATTRSETRARTLQDRGLEPFVCDVMQPDTLNLLPAVDTTLLAVGYDRASCNTIGEVYVDGVRNLLDTLAASERVVYVSSTGVYGQQEGEWVDETSPCDPLRPGGHACLAAERLLAQSAVGSRTIVLRLAGIYGPGRLPNLRTVAARDEVLAPAGSYLNLIHVDDAVMATVAAARFRDASDVFLVSDNHPVLRREYYRELARQTGIDPDLIRFVDNKSQQSPGGGHARRVAGNKRIRSDKIMKAMGLDWRFPSYREGLAAACIALDG